MIKRAVKKVYQCFTNQPSVGYVPEAKPLVHMHCARYAVVTLRHKEGSDRGGIVLPSIVYFPSRHRGGND